ncbi:Uncharacterised protein [Bordetella ansorpii]|uniref:Lipoprotein n=1 Tax=Bordetella ansorpii TaxID=288768 RepID=A0A157R2H7_9BORD|nr:hypothetical protein [Bordetella ansorpii]SAI52160.1 Uncharacterised protein [Bordetella ansorpii]
MAYPSHDAMRRALMAGAFACATLAGATHAQQPSGHTPASATQPRPPQPGQPDTDPKVQNVEKSGASRTAPPGRIESNRKAGDDSGTESRDGKSQPGSTAGSTGNAGMPGAGATSGSGGSADHR